MWSLLSIWSVRGNYIASFWHRTTVCSVSQKCPCSSTCSALLHEDFLLGCRILLPCLLTMFRSMVQHTCSASCTVCMHRSPMGMLSQAISFVHYCFHRVCCTCHCLQREPDQTRMAGLGRLHPVSGSPVEQTAVTCSHMSASGKAGLCGNQPARAGSSLQKEDKHTI